jgi:tetratricopeptide (TPR) repeat protein
MKIFLFFIALFSIVFLNAQDVNTLIKQGEQLESYMNDEQAIIKYKEALKLQPGNLYVICKCSELCSKIGGRNKADEKKMTDYYTAAKVYAERAIKLDQQSSEANFVMAMVIGRTAMQKAGRDKLNSVRDIKKYAELAIKYDPNNFKAWHVMGKWFYEISVLNFFERAAARLFYGTLPKASINDAIRAFEKSKELNPGLLLNYLELAKAYKKNSEDAKAKLLLKNMLLLPLKTEDDPSIISEGTALLKKWN